MGIDTSCLLMLYCKFNFLLMSLMCKTWYEGNVGSRAKSVFIASLIMTNVYNLVFLDDIVNHKLADIILLWRKCIHSPLRCQMAPWVPSRNYFLYLQVVKGLLYLWELKIMHRGKQGLELELLKLIHENFFEVQRRPQF